MAEKKESKLISVKNKIKAFFKNNPKAIIYSVIAVVGSLLFLTFGVWYLIPGKRLDVAVLDKTVPADGAAVDLSHISYRKHYGFFWLLNNEKYKNPNSNKYYDYSLDYYGNVPDEFGKPQIYGFNNAKGTPDVVYLSDTYGYGTSDPNDKSGKSGLSHDDFSFAATSNDSGATLIAESDVVSSYTDDSVVNEFSERMGIELTTWRGRYISELADLTDIPEWALTMHQTQFGRPFEYEGSGILLVSNGGEIIVLEAGKDFKNPDSLMRIFITDDYKKEFGSININYYNWFDIVSANYGTETVAEFSLNLNSEGKKKIADITVGDTFPAIVRTNSGLGETYLFAGDFNDYVANAKYGNFFFSESFYRTFSFDKPGDITYFYWQFFYPTVSKIMDKAYSNTKLTAKSKTEKNTESTFTVKDNSFKFNNKEAEVLNLKGFNISGILPGSKAGEYTRNASVYKTYFDSIAEMSGNSVGVYSLMPPEFYRAVYEYNLNDKEKPIYFFQAINIPESINLSEKLSDTVKDEIIKYIKNSVDAVNGNLKYKSSDGSECTYINDVSKYLIGYIININDDENSSLPEFIKVNPDYSFSGEYLSSSNNPAEALFAMMGDYAMSYQKNEYSFISPVGVEGNPMLLSGASWTAGTNGVYNLDNIKVKGKAAELFFLSYKLMPGDKTVLTNTGAFSDFRDSEGSFPYGGYIEKVKKLTSNPVMINGLGVSTNNNLYESDTSVNGLSENDQGSFLVRMLKSVSENGFMGGIISNYDDNWTAVSEDFKKYVLTQDSHLWHNTADPAENMGVVSLDPPAPTNIGMSLSDVGIMKSLNISKDPSYIYIDAIFTEPINYDTHELFIGIDTYLRNNGEYNYWGSYLATSLSGMEYVIRLESKNSASLYVIPPYDRSKGGFTSTELYNGKYNFLCNLNYGNFDNATSNFYMSGNTIKIRLPWNALNFINPVKKIVLNDTRTPAEIAASPQIGNITVDGCIFSVMLGNKTTKDADYFFPANKQSAGYKQFKWDAWEKPSYQIKQKASCKIIMSYFSSIK